eukprot:4600086-Prymnesium_polylepis.1
MVWLTCGNGVAHVRRCRGGARQGRCALPNALARRPVGNQWAISGQSGGNLPRLLVGQRGNQWAISG